MLNLQKKDKDGIISSKADFFFPGGVGESSNCMACLNIKTAVAEINTKKNLSGLATV